MSDMPDIPYASKTDVSHMDLVQLMTYYDKHIRQHSSYEKKGVINAMKRCLKAGVTLQQLWQAVRHYEQDPWVQEADQRMRKSLRAFFTTVNIAQWQKPVKAKEEADPRETLKRLLEMGERNQPPGRPIPTRPRSNDDDELVEL